MVLPRFYSLVLLFGWLLPVLIEKPDAFAHGDHAFIQNKGQWPEPVAFRTQIESHRVWIENKRLTYELVNPGSHPLAQEHARRFHEKPDTSKYVAHVYRVHFDGSENVKPQPESKPELTTYNFYLQNDPKKWRESVPSFSSVRYNNLYKGISLSLKSGSQFLKYDFELDAGNDGSAIQLRFEGDHGLEIRNGKLRIRTVLGVVEEHIPKAYQLIKGIAREVSCSYVLKGNKVGFRFSKKLDPEFPTVIDPLLIFFTYSGATSDNWANTAVSDRDGSTYTAGTVYGTGYPTTVGAFDRSYNGSLIQNPYLSYDVGILKFDKNGKQLLSSTFLGGAGADTPHSLAIDEQQNLLILGSTSSSNFPVSSNAAQRVFQGGPVEYPFGYEDGFIPPTYANGSDIFVTRLSANSQSLMASTFLGGSGTDGLMTVYENLVTNYGDQFRGDVLVDSDGSVFVASYTHSSNFPMVNSFQSTLSGSLDGVLVKLNPNLSQILFSTLFGGSGEDVFFSAKFQGNSRIVLCGGSTSSDLQMPANTYQRTKNGRGIDGFAVVFNRLTGNWVSSTYTGSSAYDQAYLVDTDQEGNVYLFGQTQGQMPRTANVFGNARGGQFLQKFSPDLRSLAWATTYGPTPFQPNIVPTSLMIDSCGRIFMAGWGGKVNYSGPGFTGGYTFGMPVTSDAIQPTTQDSSDFYFLVLTRNASSMLYGTYLGGRGRGEHVDGGTSRFDKRGVITQAVCGCRANNGVFFRGSPGAYQENIRSNNCNNGVMKINLFDLKVNFDIAGIIRCPATLTLTNNSENGETYTWYFGNGDSLQSNSRTVTYTYTSPGSYKITLKAINPLTCKFQDIAYDSVTIPDPINIPNSIPTDSFCVNETLNPDFKELSGYSVSWSPQNYLSDPTSNNPTITPLGSIDYTISVKNTQGCISKVKYKLRNKKINLGFGIEKTYLPCDGIYNIRYFSNRDSSERYIWYFENGDTATGPEVFRTYTRNGRYPVQLNGLKSGCEENAFDTLDLLEQKINIVPSFSTSRLYDGCQQPFLVFQNNTLNGQSFLWDFGDGVKSTEINPRHRFETPGTYEVKLEAFKDNCREVFTKIVTVDEFSAPNLLTFNGDDKNDVLVVKGLQNDWGLEIYNRWGNKIFDTPAYQNNWKPEDVEGGVYFYNIRFPDGEHCNSWLQVVKK